MKLSFDCQLHKQPRNYRIGKEPQIPGSKLILFTQCYLGDHAVSD